MNTKKPSKQVGSIFANVALGVAAVGSVAAVTADWSAQQAALAVQRQQGQLFTVLNDAVGNYMTLLYTQLTEQTADGTDKIPGTCATLPYRVGESVAIHADILAKKCTLTVPLSSSATSTSTSTATSTATYTLDNALQPTLSDLKALGILDRNISETPAMPTESLVSGPDSAGGKSKTLAPNGYAISIEPKCVGLGTAASACNKTNKALISSVINIQPFAQSQYTQNFTTLLWAAGPDAAMSGPADADNVVAQQDLRINPTGEFRSVQAGWTRNNPVKQEWSVTAGSTTTSYTRGVDNLMLMRNGYDSAYWQLARRDGSTPPTANWDFNGKDLTNVGKLTAASAEISGDLRVGGNQTVTGNSTISGNQSITGNLNTEGTGTFRGLLKALGDLLVMGATDLRGTRQVAGAALFKDNVTLQKNLSVGGNAQIAGTLTGSSAEFSGVLTANSLHIGGTQIGAGGTLLGAMGGWGVTPTSACSSNLALAQSTDGKLQICRSGAWTPLITSENIVITAPGTGQSCSPEGAPGRLPDGTLAVCKDGQWQSTAQGNASVGGACSVAGAVATTNINRRMRLVACRDGAWTKDTFAKPHLGYATGGGECGLEDEMALDGRGYPSLLVCKNSKWQPPGTQLLVNMQQGTSCTLEGVLASDIDHTGLLVCKGGVWAKTTEPVAMGSACAPEGRQVTLTPANGGRMYCMDGHWTDSLKLIRLDGVTVILTRPVWFEGFAYYLYSEPGWGPNKPQTYSNIAHMLFYKPGYIEDVGNWQGHGPESITTTLNRYTPYSAPDIGWRDTDGRLYRFELPSASDLERISTAFGGRPDRWRIELHGGAEFWTATRRDECTNRGCPSFGSADNLVWAGGGGDWWDHATFDLWFNRNSYHRRNTESRPVILRAI